MVLSSQMPRPANRWRHMTNERRRARRPWIVLALLVLVGVPVGWFVLRSVRGGTDEPSAPPTAGDASANGAAPSASPAPGEAPGAGARSKVDADDGVISQGDRLALRRADPALSGSVLSGSASPSAPTPPPPPPPNPPASGATRGGASPAVPPTSADDSTTGAASHEVVATPEPISRAMALSQRDPLEARRQLTALVSDARLSPAERAKAREAAGGISAAILFSGTILPGDPYARSYVVQSGDSLARIARSQGLDADWRLIKRVNGIGDEGKLRAGQAVKVVPGAFHAIVDKSDFRMDLFLGDGPQRVFVTSLPVGLGEYNSTPTGRFKVRPRSKLIDPAWTNPRTGEYHKPDDPKNPIGEHWIGIQGIDDSNAAIEGYGIHGTVEPNSIGHQASMGCVRMGAADIALVYELLTEPNSTVTIVE